MADFPEALRPHIKPSSILVFPTSLINIEEEEENFIYELQQICNIKSSEKEPLGEHITSNAFDIGDTLLLSTDEENYITGFAITLTKDDDTFIIVLCSHTPGVAPKLMAKIEEIAKEKGHKRITADAINKSLVKYYARYGFVPKERPDAYKIYVTNNYIEKQLGGRVLRLSRTKRRKVLSRRRRLHRQ